MNIVKLWNHITNCISFCNIKLNILTIAVLNRLLTPSFWKVRHSVHCAKKKKKKHQSCGLFRYMGLQSLVENQKSGSTLKNDNKNSILDFCKCCIILVSLRSLLSFLGIFQILKLQPCKLFLGFTNKTGYLPAEVLPSRFKFYIQSEVTSYTHLREHLWTSFKFLQVLPWS